MEPPPDPVRDVLGHRCKLAVVIPSTNTVVEPEYCAMAPAGVTVHSGRMLISNPDTGSDLAFLGLMDQVRASLEGAIRDVRTAEPDHLALGMTAVAFLGGLEGERALACRIAESAGVPVTTGPEAVTEALRRFGVQRIALLSPYQAITEDQVLRYFADSGVEVARLRSLRSLSATSIAKVPAAQVHAMFEEIDGPDVDALVQVGTNLAMARLVNELEVRRAKPVIAINAATFWLSLRRAGVADPIAGFGRLLAEH